MKKLLVCVNIDYERGNKIKTLKILTAIVALFTITAILPVFATAQTMETKPQIKWNFGSLASQCVYPFIAVEITGRFETYVDLSNDVVARDYIQQAIDAAIKLCPDIMKKNGISIDISLYNPENKVLITGKLDLASKKLECHNYVVEAIELSKAQKKAGEEIAQRIKKEEEGLQIDWEIEDKGIWGVNITGKFRNAVDLSDDAATKRFINLARDIVLLKYSTSTRDVTKFLTIYLFSPKGPQDKYYILAQADAWGELKYTNYATHYAAQQKVQEDTKKMLDAFLQKYKVEIWISSSEMKSRLTSNPFQWKGKIVGFEAEFGGMLSEDSGIFDLGDFDLVIVKGLSSTRFTRSGERFLLAGRVQGTSQTQVPFLGNVSVPALSFIGAAEPLRK